MLCYYNRVAVLGSIPKETLGSSVSINGSRFRVPIVRVDLESERSVFYDN